MNSLIAFVAFVGAASAASLDSRIVNGQTATYGEHPYICSLQLRQGASWYHICGCVIFNENTVVTAAHCVDGTNAASLRISAGQHTMSMTETYEQTKNVGAVIMHPQYNGNAGGFPNDVAVLTFDSALTFDNYVMPFEFDEDTSNTWVGQKCTLSGWGRLSGSGSGANTLMKVDMTKISNAECSARWASVGGANINAGHICFYEPPKSACSGDSGGPVRCGNTITGVTSWGVSTCDGNFPSVYTRLSYFMSWVRANAV